MTWLSRRTFAASNSRYRDPPPASSRLSNETFYLDLFGNSSNALFTKNRGLGTILNDD